jgi:hypothetical protein
MIRRAMQLVTPSALDEEPTALIERNPCAKKGIP